MDRRSFLRATSIVTRPALTGRGIISRVLRAPSGAVGLTQLLGEYGTLANQILDNHSIKTWPYKPESQNIAKAFPILGKIAQKAIELIGRSDVNEAFQAIMSVNAYFGTQIFCQHFSRFTQDQRRQVMEKLFFVREVDKDGSLVNLPDLSGWFSEPRDAQRYHPTFLDSEEYIAQWLHRLPMDEFQKFINALPEFGSHFHEWTVGNFFSYVFDAENYLDHNSGVERLSYLYESVRSPKWKRLFLELMIDHLDSYGGDIGEFASLSNSNLMRNSLGILERLEQAKDSFGEIHMGNFEEWSSLRAKIISNSPLFEDALVSRLSGGLRAGEVDSEGIILPFFASVAGQPLDRISMIGNESTASLNQDKSLSLGNE